MRLWSLHPRYLDPKGLVALWRETLLAQAVLAGKTRGYRHHPQLERFRAVRDPLAAIGYYLRVVAEEAGARGYEFDSSRILKPGRALPGRIPVTRGQLRFEREHLLAKLAKRDPQRGVDVSRAKRLEPHPLFRAKAGPVETWERDPGSSPTARYPNAVKARRARRKPIMPNSP